MTEAERQQVQSETRVQMAYALERLGVPASIIAEALVSVTVDQKVIDTFREQLDKHGHERGQRTPREPPFSRPSHRGLRDCRRFEVAAAELSPSDLDALSRRLAAIHSTWRMPERSSNGRSADLDPHSKAEK
jgi:hypothetical protein